MKKRNIVFANIATSLLLQLTTAVAGFIVPPLIILYYGSSINGMLASVRQFLAYITIVEAGVGTASIFALYKPLAEKSIVCRNSILAATKNFYKKAGFIFLGLVVVLSVIYPLLVSNQVDFLFASFIVLFLGMSGVVDFLLIGKYLVLLTADQKSYVVALAQLVGVILNTTCTIILLKLHLSLLIVFGVSSILYLSRYIILRLYSRNKYESLSFLGIPDNKAISQKRDVLIHQIAGLVVFNSPTVILTIFCSLKEVSVYSVYSLVFSSVRMLLQSFSNGIQSMHGENIAKEDRRQLLKDHSRFEGMYFSLVFWSYTCAAVLILPFIRLYTKGMSDVEYVRPLLAMLFVVAGIANDIRVPGNVFINAVGHFKLTRSRAIIEATINIIFSIIFVVLFGMEGVLLGCICSFAYRSIDIIIYSSSQIGRSIWKPFVSIVGLSSLSVVFYTLSKDRVSNAISSYSEWVCQALLIGAIFAFAIILYRSIEKIISQRISKNG